MSDRGRWRRLAACAGTLVVAVLGTGGCGGGGAEDDRPRVAPVVGQGIPPQVDHPVAAAIDDLQQAFLAGDYEGICDRSTRAAARQVGEAAHGDITQCVRDVRRLFVMVEKIDGWRHAGMPRVIDVEAEGDDAVATVALDRRWRARVPMTLEDGRWRLSGMFGDPPRRARRVVAAIPGGDFPAPGPSEVAFERGDGEPCAALSPDRYPRIGGGCRLRLAGRVTPLTILTAFGDFRLDRCSIAYEVRVDAAGRTWTEDFDVNGDARSVACGDVNACYDYAREELVPWRGRLYAQDDGSYVHRMDMCLRTCVGYFIGKLVVRLVPEGDGWRAEPVDGGGDTGFRFDSPLRVRTDIRL